MESEFPSNSNTSKGAARRELPEKKVEQVTTGAVIKRKKSLGKRFAETFTGDNTKNAINHAVFEVAVPALKDLVSDMVREAVDRRLWGESSRSSRRSPYRGGGLVGHTAYNRVSAPPGMRRDEPRVPSNRSRATHDFGELIFTSRAEATEVIDQLYALIAQYEVATVADLYELSGLTGDFTDNRWGWTDMRGSDVRHVSDGYLIDLPRPQQVD